MFFPYDEVVHAIAIDVAGRGDGPESLAVHLCGIETEAIAAVHRSEIEARREPGVGSEDDITDVELTIKGVGANDQVVDAVAVDVAGSGDGTARPVEAEAIVAIERCQIEAGGEAGAGAEDDIARASVIFAGIRSADDYVIDAVAVDVAGSGYGGAAESVVPGAVEAKAVSARERCEIDASREAGVGA